MVGKTHIIIGVTSKVSEKIGVLQKEGNKDIYVLDFDQLSKVKKVDGITYLSAEWATRFILKDPDIVCHYFIYQRRGEKRGKDDVNKI